MEAAVDVKYRPVPFPNGGVGVGVAVAPAAKKMRPASAAAAPAGVYRECLKNHAAGLGGHAVDGCGEFMPSPAADPAVPGSLRCAACGCHRNFHRRVPEAPPSPPLLALPPPPPPPHPHPRAPPPVLDSRAGEETPGDRGDDDDDDDDTDESDEESDFDEDRPTSPLPAPAIGLPPGYLPSATQMLLSLSSGAPGASAPVVAPRQRDLAPGPGVTVPGAAAAAAAAAARKRFRTKFSPEQKQRMQALSERLGWRLQKRDEAVVEECCREMGVTKGVFKVWMHNNKHNFVGGHSARRSASAAAAHHPSHAAAAHPPSQPPAPVAVRPSSQPPAPAAVHPSSQPPAPVAAAPPPVHADFNINGVADYFRVQPATAAASAGSPPQSS